MVLPFLCKIFNIYFLLILKKKQKSEVQPE